jgi:hypothetical protein
VVCLDYIEVDQVVQLDDSQFVYVNHVQLDDLEKVVQLDDSQVVCFDTLNVACRPTSLQFKWTMYQVSYWIVVQVSKWTMYQLDYGLTRPWSKWTV